MRNNNTNNAKTLSPETKSFIDSLSLLIEVEDNLLSAFSSMYGGGFGDGEGDSMYHRSELPGMIETLKDGISKWLGHSVVLSLGDSQRVNDNIL